MVIYPHLAMYDKSGLREKISTLVFIVYPCVEGSLVVGGRVPLPAPTFLSAPSSLRATQHDNLPRKLFSSGIKPPEFSQTSRQLIWCNFWDPLKFWRKDDYVGISLHVSANSFLLNVNCVPLLHAGGSLLQARRFKIKLLWLHEVKPNQKVISNFVWQSWRSSLKILRRF